MAAGVPSVGGVGLGGSRDPTPATFPSLKRLRQRTILAQDQTWLLAATRDCYTECSATTFEWCECKSGFRAACGPTRRAREKPDNPKRASMGPQVSPNPFEINAWELDFKDLQS